MAPGGDQDLSAFPEPIQSALKYERANWVNGSVHDDPFYTVPSDFGDAPAGSLLKVETANASLYDLPPGTSLSRIIYQSLTLSGERVPVSAFVLFPYMPRTQPDGSWRVLAWAHGTSGVFADCAPSHIRNLWHHFLAPFPLALQGYVVVATDYAGQGISVNARGEHITHEYLAAPAAANNVLYSVQAAREAFPRLSRDFVTMGHSQGGAAVWALAEKQAESPIEGYLGGIPISPVTRLLNLPPESPVIETLGVSLLTGMQKYFPDFDPDTLLTEEGQMRRNLIIQSQGCAPSVAGLLAGVQALKPDWREDKFIQQYQNITAVGGKPVGMPLLVIQGESDPLMPPAVALSATEDTAAVNQGTSVEYMSYANTSHIPALTVSQSLWLDWIKDRFERKELQKGLQTKSFTPIRPAEDYPAELTWYIAWATEFYQVL